MQQITLAPIPSQSFITTVGGNRYGFKFYSIDGHTAYDLDINGVNVISGFKMVNDVPLLPYKYQEVNGNFIMSLPEREIPDYTRFGASQLLFYMDANESAAYRTVTGL